jgi:hypothetical protein
MKWAIPVLLVAFIFGYCSVLVLASMDATACNGCTLRDAKTWLTCTGGVRDGQTQAPSPSCDPCCAKNESGLLFCYHQDFEP